MLLPFKNKTKQKNRPTGCNNICILKFNRSFQVVFQTIVYILTRTFHIRTFIFQHLIFKFLPILCKWNGIIYFAFPQLLWKLNSFSYVYIPFGFLYYLYFQTHFFFFFSFSHWFLGVLAMLSILILCWPCW